MSSGLRSKRRTLHEENKMSRTFLRIVNSQVKLYIPRDKLSSNLCIVVPIISYEAIFSPTEIWPVRSASQNRGAELDNPRSTSEQLAFTTQLRLPTIIPEASEYSVLYPDCYFRVCPGLLHFTNAIRTNSIQHNEPAR
jgi:hypothetical protein